MRKSIFLLPAILINLVLLNSCKKEIPANAPNNEIISKVNVWLDIRKPVNKTTQSANIELLRNNLNYSELRIEQSAQNEKIVIIPIKEGLKTEKNIDKNAIPNLVLILDNMGNIRKGNIVLYLPANGETLSKVPDNSFYKILNTGDPDCNGKFRYLSVTGKRLHELEYQNSRLKSVSNFRDSSNNYTTARIATCVDWYWVTTVYDEWGYVISETWEYYTTTCQGEDCIDPYNAMLCPTDNSSGGGTGSAEGLEFEEARYKGADFPWLVQEVSGQFGGGHFFQWNHLVAKFYKRNPQNNHFVGGSSSHINLYSNSWGSNGTIGYLNTSSTVTVNSNTQVTLTSSGTIRFNVNNVTYDYSGSKAVLFSQCTWN